MNDVDQKIRRVLAELVDTAPIADGPMPSNRGETLTRHRLAAAPAVFVAILALIGLGLVARSLRETASVGPDREAVQADSEVATPGGEGGGLLSSPLGPREWALPSVLPAGYEYDLSISSFGERRVVYLNPTTDSTLRVSTLGDDQQYALTEGDNSLVQAGPETWQRTTSGSWFRLSDGVQVQGEVPDEELQTFLEAIQVVDETALPRPPLILEPGSPLYTTVATTPVGDEALALSVMTDGVYYAAQYGESGGCCSTLAAGQTVLLSGGSGPITAANPDQSRDVGLIYGLVDNSVETIEVHLKDGTVINTTPQDLDDTFPINFFLVTVPADNDPFDMLETIRAFNGAGTEIGRVDQF